MWRRRASWVLSAGCRCGSRTGLCCSPRCRAARSDVSATATRCGSRSSPSRRWRSRPEGVRRRRAMAARRVAALVFDLDGTLVDSVYQHVLAWHRALLESGIELSVWRIHRRIGMSGGLFARALLRETGRDLDAGFLQQLQDRHAAAYKQLAGDVRPLPGTLELLARLTELGCPWSIATSGRMETAGPILERLGIPKSVPIVTRDQVERAKPDPDLFLAALERLSVRATDAYVVGDSVWDMLTARRAGVLGVGVLSGGYGDDELERAGAYRVYDDPAMLMQHLDELGVRSDGA